MDTGDPSGSGGGGSGTGEPNSTPSSKNAAADVAAKDVSASSSSTVDGVKPEDARMDAREAKRRQKAADAALAKEKRDADNARATAAAKAAADEIQRKKSEEKAKRLAKSAADKQKRAEEKQRSLDAAQREGAQREAEHKRANELSADAERVLSTVLAAPQTHYELNRVLIEHLNSAQSDAYRQRVVEPAMLDRAASIKRDDTYCKRLEEAADPESRTAKEETTDQSAASATATAAGADYNVSPTAAARSKKGGRKPKSTAAPAPQFNASTDLSSLVLPQRRAAKASRPYLSGNLQRNDAPGAGGVAGGANGGDSSPESSLTGCDQRNERYRGWQ